VIAVRKKKGFVVEGAGVIQWSLMFREGLNLNSFTFVVD